LRIIALKIVIITELPIFIANFSVGLVIYWFSTSNPYWAAPPISKMNKANILYDIFLVIAPFIVIPAFSQQISSGYGALSILIFCPFTSKSLSGRHGVQKN